MSSLIDRIKNMINHLVKNSGATQPTTQVQPAQGNNIGQKVNSDLVFDPNVVGTIPQMIDKYINPDHMTMEEQQIMRYQQDTKQRSDLSEWVKVVISIWLIMVIVIIIALGNGCLHLSENIIITLLITTTANILGMAYLVLGDLFPKGEGALKTFMNR